MPRSCRRCARASRTRASCCARSRATLLRSGEKNAWLEIVLEEGRNRQIRRLLAAFDINVLRLVRVAIGQLPLGELGKGQWRELSAEKWRRWVAVIRCHPGRCAEARPMLDLACVGSILVHRNCRRWPAATPAERAT